MQTETLSVKRGHTTAIFEKATPTVGATFQRGAATQPRPLARCGIPTRAEWATTTSISSSASCHSHRARRRRRHRRRCRRRRAHRRRRSRRRRRHRQSGLRHAATIRRLAMILCNRDTLLPTGPPGCTMKAQATTAQKPSLKTTALRRLSLPHATRQRGTGTRVTTTTVPPLVGAPTPAHRGSTTCATCAKHASTAAVHTRFKTRCMWRPCLQSRHRRRLRRRRRRRPHRRRRRRRRPTTVSRPSVGCGPTTL